MPDLLGEKRDSVDRDVSIRRALARLQEENQRLKTLVVSLSKLVLEKVVSEDAGKNESD